MFYFIAIISVIAGVLIDQYSKYLAATYLPENTVKLIDGVFHLHYLENRGAAFGILQNQQLFFLIATIITLIFVTFLYVKLPRTKHFLPLRICLIAMSAGAIGNMIDRIRLHYVIDFFYFVPIDFPIFNVADIYASVATAVLIFLFVFYYKEEDFDIIFQLFKKKRHQEKQ